MTQTFDSDRLAAMVIAKRDGRGLRATATEIGGVSASTLSRIEQGKIPDLDTFLRLCRWLDVSADEFMQSPAVKPRRTEAGGWTSSPRICGLTGHSIEPPPAPWSG